MNTITLADGKQITHDPESDSWLVSLQRPGYYNSQVGCSAPHALYHSYQQALLLALALYDRPTCLSVGLGGGSLFSAVKRVVNDATAVEKDDATLRLAVDYLGFPNESSVIVQDILLLDDAALGVDVLQIDIPSAYEKAPELYSLPFYRRLATHCPGTVAVNISGQRAAHHFDHMLGFRTAFYDRQCFAFPSGDPGELVLFAVPSGLVFDDRARERVEAVGELAETDLSPLIFPFNFYMAG